MAILTSCERKRELAKEVELSRDGIIKSESFLPFSINRKTIYLFFLYLLETVIENVCVISDGFCSH